MFFSREISFFYSHYRKRFVNDLVFRISEFLGCVSWLRCLRSWPACCLEQIPPNLMISFLWHDRDAYDVLCFLCLIKTPNFVKSQRSISLSVRRRYKPRGFNSRKKNTSRGKFWKVVYIYQFRRGHVFVSLLTLVFKELKDRRGVELLKKITGLY